ncbi:hypothetical protein EYC84_006705 [Monilinia fructicola]|uniref:Uncharacterized protein n=1 Tax=Monilinia fructicola TaxID=38448 RepID=A0A5M9K6X8_MONFR|nr:hypothetical protein EYC84_006705 [Monilinia fructicola]
MGEQHCQKAAKLIKIQSDRYHELYIPGTYFGYAYFYTDNTMEPRNVFLEERSSQHHHPSNCSTMRRERIST